MSMNDKRHLWKAVRPFICNGAALEPGDLFIAKRKDFPLWNVQLAKPLLQIDPCHTWMGMDGYVPDWDEAETARRLAEANERVKEKENG